MDFNTYQENARLFANYHKELGPYSVILDMINNIGILGGKLYTVLEQSNGTFTPDDKARVSISLGDIMNNIANIAADLGLTLDNIVSLNLRKMELSKSKEQEQTN